MIKMFKILVLGEGCWNLVVEPFFKLKSKFFFSQTFFSLQIKGKKTKTTKLNFGGNGMQCAHLKS